MHEYDPSDTLTLAADEASLGATLPPHLAPLPGGHWAIWRWVGLRSAGFPVERLHELSGAECGEAALAALAAETRMQQAQEAALAPLRAALDTADADGRIPIIRAIQQLKKGQPPKEPVIAAATAAVAAFAEARAAAAAARAAFEQAFAAATARTSAALHAIARDERFREALIWQNRHALQTGVNALLRKGAGGARSSKQRQHEALVLNYIHRYCTKNDTIGFFGPVGWARVVDDGPAVRVVPGPELLASRSVFFDGWGIDALAELFAQDEALAPSFVPRRMAHVHVEGTTLYLPLVPPARIPRAQAAVLAACDGARTAREIAAALLADPATGLRSADEVYDILRKLRAQRRVVWTLEIPAEGLHPAAELRAALARIDREELRAPALRALDELEAARDAVAAATGDAERLDQAMAELETTFTRLSGMAATRHAGKTYAGRTLVYEDCRRDVEVSFGPEFTATVGPALGLILDSARWFTFEAATIYREAFRAIYEQLARKAGTRTVEFSSFWLYAQPLIFGDVTAPTEELERRLQQRWAAVLQLPSGQRRVAYTSAELRPRIADAFAAPQPGWQAARYQSPDLMIAAAGPEAIRRGDYLCVMGELHPGANTLKTALFVGQHPAPHELLAAVEADLPAPQVVFVASREGGGPTLRLSNALIAPHDYRLVFAHDSCGIPPERALPTGRLLLEERGGTLEVRTRDGRLRFEIIEALGEILMIQVLHHFKLLPSAAHTPRISIDRLVISREAWRFQPRALLFAALDSEQERFLAAQRWRAEHAMPRCVFVHSTAEKKPFYVDFSSPAALDLLAKAIRRAAEQDAAEGEIKITEMLPEPDGSWLIDREGRHYTSELRIVAVDQQ